MGTDTILTTINETALEQLPELVSPYVEKYLDAFGYTVKPGDVVDPTGATFASLVDYTLTLGTGIVSDDGKYVNITMITREAPMSAGTMKFIGDIRGDFHGTDGYDTEYSGTIAKSYITGTSASMDDIGTEVTSQFHMIQIVVIVLLIILLFLILGSYLTPIRAMITILLSIIWTIALTQLVFSSIMDKPVLFLIPIVLFVLLLGLGMDYDIFLTTRIRENRVRGMDVHEAIDDAIVNSGSVISLCALIMGGTFLTLLLANSTMLMEFGFALGVGILIDGLLMITFVAPALMHLMGEWSWKGPKFLKRNKVE